LRNGTARLFRVALAASLSVSALLYFAWSWRWPLVGDASLIHYIGWLIERGWAPYRDLGDMNMPGSYLIELAAMHLFGMGDLAWRLFDFALMGAATASFFAITRRAGDPSITDSSSWVGPDGTGLEGGWLAGLFAACLFILVHGRDGLAEGGQRDLTMAVCLIVATAFLFVAMRRDWPWAAAAFGLFSGVALTIKPTAILLSLAQLLLAAWVLRRSRIAQRPIRRVFARLLAPASLACLVAPAVCLVFLLRERALAAFLAGFHGIIPYYASLGHRPLHFILLHSISPLLPLVLIWIAFLALAGSFFHPLLSAEGESPRNWERTALLAGVLFGLINCVVQARALPYYRYPLLVFLLPLMAVDFTRAAQSLETEPGPVEPEPRPTELRPKLSGLWRTRAARWLAVCALCFGGFFLAPQSAVLIHRYRWWQTDFISSLEQNLDALGGQRLSGRIQCIDSISGCGTVLYRMRLTQATGVFSDFLLFGPDDVPIIRQTRANFSAAILANPPQVIVVTSHLHLGEPENYRKLDRWPAFESFLADDYTLETEWRPTRTTRWWSREETPAGYRIYVLRPRH
jgi:hypothetical protein